jgi:GcrA cell cycle regulator
MPAALATSWNDDNTERLRGFWDEGLTASEIGCRLGLTNNAVIGKVWRLALPRRREAQPNSDRPEITFPARDECFWLIGHPHTAGFHFCGQPAVAGKPYCEAHCRRAYVRFTNRPAEHEPW